MTSPRTDLAGERTPHRDRSGAAALATTGEELAGATLSPRKGRRVLIETDSLLWIDLDDPASPELDRLAAEHGFHELAVEDCRNHPQLAKIDPFGDHVFLIANSIRFDPDTHDLEIREIDAFVSDRLLVTVHEGPSLSIEGVAERVRASDRTATPARVLHALLDSILDRFMPTLDGIGATIDELEETLFETLDRACLEKIFQLRRNLVSFRRAAVAQRELLNALSRRDTTIVPEDMLIYFRDVYDHVIAVIEMIESYRDLLAAALEIYLTQAANRTNDVVKTLTIIATFLLPLTVITGWYGMNVENLPFAESPYGVWIVTAGMVLVTGSLLAYFRSRGWL